MAFNPDPTKQSLNSFYRRILLLLVLIFVVYNYIIYTGGTENKFPKLNEQALKGQQLWQEKNCTACHQLYGLGGQLGPDLTNVFSAKSKGPAYIKAFLNSGVKWMPRFEFTEEEKDQIVAFLKLVDKTGYFPNHNARLTNLGWVELEYKEGD